MAIDPRQLRPSELVRLLNSSPLGEVIGQRQLLRHRTRAGFRIGDGRRIDLFRYVAWLVAVRQEASATMATAAKPPSSTVNTAPKWTKGP